MNNNFLGYKLNITYKLLTPKEFFNQFFIEGNSFKKIIYLLLFLNNLINNFFVHYPRGFRSFLLMVAFLGGIHLVEPYFVNIYFFKTIFAIFYIQIILNLFNKLFNIRSILYRTSKVDLYCIIGNMETILNEAKVLTPKLVGTLIVGTGVYHTGNEVLITQNIERFNQDILPLLANNASNSELLAENKKIICSIERDLFHTLVNNHAIDGFINKPAKSSIINLAANLDTLLVICDAEKIKLDYKLISNFETLFVDLNKSIASTQNSSVLVGDATTLIRDVVLKGK